MQKYDAIVLGLGGMGSAALYHFARRGLRVCGIEQFAPAHAHGSSHGHTRIIRRSYFEHPAYVPLVNASWDLWRELEEATRTQLFVRAGLLLAGPAEGVIIAGVRRAAKEHALAIENLTHADAVKRWPGFAFAENTDVLFEPDAGYLLVEECVRQHIRAAQNAGADARFNESVTSWTADTKGVAITTNHEHYAADRLVICAGAWTSQVLVRLAVNLKVIKKSVFWFPNSKLVMQESAGCPVFGFDTPAGFCYGFPAIDDRGVKIGNHSGGVTMPDPDCRQHQPESADLPTLDEFRKRHLPGVDAQVGEQSVCSYTMTPDEHFIIDRHPDHLNVFLAGGFSGHGFKFAPVIGSILADLAIEGQTTYPIEPYKLSRFSAQG